MYNSSTFPAWRSYVERACPDVQVQWEDNRNSCTNILYMAKHGNIPDIIAIRRFESDSALQLEPYLFDLSSLDITKSFVPEYLEPFNNGGRQNWLPQPFLVEGIYANKELFERHNVALPKDLRSFILACNEFEKYGFVACGFDCTQGWTNTALIEGFGAAKILTSEEQRQNRKAFSAGVMQQLDKKVTFSIADTLRDLKQNGILTNEDLTMRTDENIEQFQDGTMAMYITNSDGNNNPSGKYQYVLLPFFGDKEENSILYTYPVFSLALSNNLNKSIAHRKACLEVFTAMFSENAQKILSQDTDGLISPQKEITLKLSSVMDNVKPLIENHRCYIRELNINTFSACTAVVKALVNDDIDNETFFSLLNDILLKKKETHEIGTSAIQATNKLDSACNSPAAGIVADMLKNQTGVQCAIIDSREVAAPFYKGAYTSEDVAAVLLDGPVYKAKLTDVEMGELLDTLIIYTTTFIPGGVEPLVDYPVLSGVTVEMKTDGTILSKMNSGTYMIVISARIFNSLKSTSNEMTKKFVKLDTTLETYIDREFIMNGLPKPHSYYMVRR